MHLTMEPFSRVIISIPIVESRAPMSNIYGAMLPSKPETFTGRSPVMVSTGPMPCVQ